MFSYDLNSAITALISVTAYGFFIGSLFSIIRSFTIGTLEFRPT